MKVKSLNAAHRVQPSPHAYPAPAKPSKRQCKKTVRTFYNGGTVTLIVELHISRARVRQERRDVRDGGPTVATQLAKEVGGSYGVLGINFTKPTKISDAPRIDTAIVTVTAGKVSMVKLYLPLIARNLGISQRVTFIKAEQFEFRAGDVHPIDEKTRDRTVDQLIKKWGPILSSPGLTQGS